MRAFFSGLALAGMVGLSAASLAAPAGVPLGAQAGPEDAVSFERHIKPIFAEHCYSCHGPERRRGGLRLDIKPAAFQGGDSGPAIVAGNSAESRLFRFISGRDPDILMPPEGDPLTPEQLALIEQWIDAGAVWPEEDAGTAPATRSDHWAFEAVQRPELPKVKNPGWVRRPIDAFILARLEQESIEPSPEADPSTLLRRLHLDLTGLPPTPEEVDAFLNDPRPDAYEKLADRLLASPHFGERWARHWLDLARYADSDGYEKDNVRPWAWVYRNWVIDAINRDLPFDQFTIEQIAGDLLPNATQDQNVATGFHRQTLTNREGGVDQEEFRTTAVVDRVNTIGTVWLGLTLACAECHTHKYDPITQREYFQFYAFFNNADETDIRAPFPDELEEYNGEKAAWDEQNARFTAARDVYAKTELPAGLAEWEASVRIPETRWTVLKPSKTDATDRVTLRTVGGDWIEAGGRSPATATYTVEVEAEFESVTGFRLEVDGGKTAGRSSSGNFVLSEFTVRVQGEGEDEPVQVRLQNASATFEQNNYPISGAIDGKSEAGNGWAVGPRVRQRHVAVFETAEPLRLGAGDQLTFVLDQRHGTEHTVNRFRLSTTASPQPLEAEIIPDEIVAILANPGVERSAAEQEQLLRFYGTIDEGLIAWNDRIEQHVKNAPEFPPTRAMAMTERDNNRRTTRIHIRGDFLQPGDPVEPGVPAVLPPLETGNEQPTRLDLATWLVDPANPLTARVTVNHAWQHLFGRGLVATVDDFGARGEAPTHPELLDWLAAGFMESGWSRKELIRLIVTSSAYRQSSGYRHDLAGRDPNNVLLARQSRLRLEAEGIRDIHLAASGLLHRDVGGPSIRPPLPADIAALGYNNQVRWTESQAPEKYKRGLYILMQRTVPYPMLTTFDAPDRTVTCARRERSNTPLQSLTLLNDPVFFECAQALGRKVASRKNGAPADEQIRHLFKLCLSREPTDLELSRLRQFYEDQRRLLRDRPGSAANIVSGAQGSSSASGASYDQPVGATETVGNANADSETVIEQATLVAVARILMNLDEFITRE